MSYYHTKSRPSFPSGGLTSNDQKRHHRVIDDEADDSLWRDVYWILGTPIDLIDLNTVLGRIELAAARLTPFFLSTPNLNFLVQARSDPNFRESLLQSDLCPPDGTPIIWLGRLLGIPIKRRVAGSDILSALKLRVKSENNLKLFLFGGAEGVAAAASRAFNASANGSRCVGWFYPGFCSVEELSGEDIIETINSSGADFLVVSLGAKKGQSWLVRNAEKLRIPIRAHLGAWINFEAGSVKRAPMIMRRLGLEWLWRIKEEPYLWRRYFYDGLVLLYLLCVRVLPLVVDRFIARDLAKARISIDIVHDNDQIKVNICGAATQHNIKEIIQRCSIALSARKRVVIDLSDTSTIDARFLGFVFMLIRNASRYGCNTRFVGLSRKVRRQFYLNGAEFLLQSQTGMLPHGGRYERSGGTIPEKKILETIESVQ